MTGKYEPTSLHSSSDYEPKAPIAGKPRASVSAVTVTSPAQPDDHSKRRLLYLLQQNELSKPSGRGRVSDINRVRTAGSSRSFVQKNPDTILSHHDPFTPTSPPHLFSR